MSKKNYRPSMQARKKVEEQKIAERYEYFRSHKKQILTIAAVALVAIVALVVLIDIFYMPMGSLRTVMGKVSGVDPTSIVRKLDNHYFEFAKMDTPEGYEATASGVNSFDEQEQVRYFVAQDENSMLSTVYVSGVKDISAKAMVEKLASMPSTYVLQGDASEAVVAGHTMNYRYCQAPSEMANPEGNYYASLIMYVDTIQDSCVLVQCDSRRMAQEELPTEEEMLAAAESVVSCLVLP